MRLAQVRGARDQLFFHRMELRRWLDPFDKRFVGLRVPLLLSMQLRKLLEWL